MYSLSVSRLQIYKIYCDSTSSDMFHLYNIEHSHSTADVCLNELNRTQSHKKQKYVFTRRKDNNERKSNDNFKDCHLY